MVARLLSLLIVFSGFELTWELAVDCRVKVVITSMRRCVVWSAPSGGKGRVHAGQ